MATDPIEITDPDGSVRIAGLANFPDGLTADPPFHAAETGVTAVMVDSPDGDPIIAFDADAGKFLVEYSTLMSSGIDMGDNSIVGASLIDGSSLGGTFAYVSVVNAPPDMGTYAGTPLVFDSTAVTGGLYAWDGAAYQQVGGPLA